MLCSWNKWKNSGEATLIAWCSLTRGSSMNCWLTRHARRRFEPSTWEPTCSDPRLRRLRELPNLKSVVLLSAVDPDKFLEELRGLTTIEELSLVFCSPSRHGIEHISSLPNLKKFGLCMGKMDSEDWELLRKALPGCKCNRVVSNR